MRLIALLCLLMGCATAKYDEAASCPGPNMTEPEYKSGYVRCRAECASWGRDIYAYDDACRCICKAKH